MCLSSVRSPRSSAWHKYPIPGAYQLVGANYFLTDESLQGLFLKPRISDVNRLEQISREVSAKKENVLVIADVPDSDSTRLWLRPTVLEKRIGFLPKILRKRQAGFGDTRLIQTPARPLRISQSIVFFSSITSSTFNFHLAERHIFGGAFDETAFRRMNFCADLVLRNREELLILCRSDTGERSVVKQIRDDNRI